MTYDSPVNESLAPPIAEGRVVLFDNVCNLCSGSVQFILRYNVDQSIQFASVQSALGQDVLRFYGMRSDVFETMLYIEDGQLYLKSTAALRIAKRLALPWRLLHSLRVVPTGVRDWPYDRIALDRYRLFGKRDQCLIPDEDVLGRFIDV